MQPTSPVPFPFPSQSPVPFPFPPPNPPPISKVFFPTYLSYLMYLVLLVRAYYYFPPLIFFFFLLSSSFPLTSTHPPTRSIDAPFLVRVLFQFYSSDSISSDLILFQQTDYKHRHAFSPFPPLFPSLTHSLPPCQLSSPVSPVLFLSSNLSIYLVNQSPLFPVTIPLHGYDRCRYIYIYICISGTDLRKAGAGSVYLALSLSVGLHVAGWGVDQVRV